MNIFRIFDKHRSPNVEACCFDIINRWKSDFSDEQKAALLRVAVQFSKIDDFRKKIFDKEGYRQQLEGFFGTRYRGIDL
jgi:hypothetical protein